jgi:hypothetical protein
MAADQIAPSGLAKPRPARSRRVSGAALGDQLVDRVLVAQLVEAVLGHHRALADVPLTRPVVGGVGEAEGVAGADGVQDLLVGRQHLGSDAVAGDERDVVVGRAPIAAIRARGRPRRSADLPHRIALSVLDGVKRAGQEGMGGRGLLRAAADQRDLERRSRRQLARKGALSGLPGTFGSRHLILMVDTIPGNAEDVSDFCRAVPATRTAPASGSMVV